MSSHFNYEIEERNMRNQLKELEVSFKEEAWFSYDDYSKQFQSVNKTQFIPNFNFALNRTVILPVVFGGIIVLFSFLLFNFVNIKNTKSASKSNASEIKASMDVVTEQPKPESKKAVVAPVKKEETPAVIKETPITATKLAAVSNTTNTYTAKTLPVVQNNLTAITPAVADAQLAKTTATTYTVEPKKKRRKKNSAEVLESIATPISLPTVTQEEAEPELR